jgi:hypothetical protein
LIAFAPRPSSTLERDRRRVRGRLPTDKGQQALVDYACTPVTVTTLKSEPLLRLLICDLVGEDVTRESLTTLHDDFADLRQRLDDSERNAKDLLHGENYLQLVIAFLRGLLDLHEQLIDDVEHASPLPAARREVLSRLAVSWASCFACSGRAWRSCWGWSVWAGGWPAPGWWVGLRGASPQVRISSRARTDGLVRRRGASALLRLVRLRGMRLRSPSPQVKCSTYMSRRHGHGATAWRFTGSAGTAEQAGV